MRAALDSFGGIDVLVNAAGVIEPARSEARNRISDAITSGLPGQPSGCVSRERWRNASYWPPSIGIVSPVIHHLTCLR